MAKNKTNDPYDDIEFLFNRLEELIEKHRYFKTQFKETKQVNTKEHKQEDGKFISHNK